MKSHWVEHKGKRVFMAEYSGFGMDSAALQQEVIEILAELEKQPPNSVLVISNVVGTTASLDNIRVLKNTMQKSNTWVRKRSVIGLSRIQRYFIDIFNDLAGSAKLEIFATRAEALDWIVGE